MHRYDETRAIFEAYEQLYKDAKEARYEGGEYAPADLQAIERRYTKVIGAMRQALGL